MILFWQSNKTAHYDAFIPAAFSGKRAYINGHYIKR
jgi:hypothetical protein